MSRIPILITASALALTACLGRTPAVDTEAPQPTAAATEAATATSETPPTSALPTATTADATQAPTETVPAPTATTSAATETPAATNTSAAATPDPNQGVGDNILFQDNLDGTSYFWSFTDEVATFGVVDGQLKGVMKAANAGWRFTISPDTLNLSRQQVRLTAHTVACGDNDEYGLMVRVKTQTDAPDQYDGYLFKLRCSGAARVDLVQGTQSTPVVDWTPSPAIKTGAGVDNTLLIWSSGGEHRFYVNDQYLFTAQDSNLTSGFYGVYLYDRTAGGLIVTFDDLIAREVAP